MAWELQEPMEMPTPCAGCEKVCEYDNLNSDFLCWDCEDN